MLVGLIAAVFGMVTGLRRAGLDKQAADDAQADRLIRLAEEEAEKRVSIVRTEFELKMAQSELTHRDEMKVLRDHLEGEIRTLRGDLTRYKCLLAPACTWRNGSVPPPANLLASS